MALLVRFRDGPQGPEETRLFPTSPVRIGRNPLNDLVLDYGFVSQWHGVIKFDRSDIAYVDLGSTNGTCLEGARIQQRTPVRVQGPHSKLSIGSLELRLEWTDGIEEGMAPRPRIKTQFVTSVPKALLGGSPGTADFAKRSLGAPAAAPERLAPAPPATDSTERSPGLDEPLMAVHQMRAHHDAYRQSWARFLGALREKIESSPPALREMTAFFMASEFPQLTREPDFAQMLTEMGVDRTTAGCFDIEEWLQRLTHNPRISASKKTSPAIAMEHIGATMEVFADSFLELRKGYDQFGKEMGLQLTYDESALERAQSLDEVMVHLMEPDADRSERLNDLRRAFAGFALHQIALLGASVEGARELLEVLSPGAISSGSQSATSGSIVLRSQALLSYLTRLWPIAPIVSWSRYKQRYETTTEEDRFTRKLFGRKFIRAYLALMGSQDRK
jgi:predicted component of type VI protein secretion system